MAYVYTSVTQPTYSNITLTAGTGTTYNVTGPSVTIANSGTWIDAPYVSAATVGQSGKLSLNGKNADLEINGESLKETLKAIKESLMIPELIQRDPKLEEEFEELKQLGLEYERKLKYFEEQKRIFNILKDDQ